MDTLLLFLFVIVGIFILFFLIAIFTPSSFQNLIRDISVCIINSTHEIDQTRVNNSI